jgi:GTP-binding protein HflX
LSKFKDKKPSSADPDKGFELSEPEPTRAAVIVPVLPERYNAGTAAEEGAKNKVGNDL